MPFDLTITSEVGKEYVPYLRRNLRRAHEILNPVLSDLSLALVADAKMKSLHGEFMNLYTTTDVLTFPLDSDDNDQVIAGEIIICVPEAKRRAKAEKTDLKNELLLYALHGMLHLSGFDDRTARDYKKMHAKEDEILTRLGIGAVFKPRLAASSLATRPTASKRKRR